MKVTQENGVLSYDDIHLPIFEYRKPTWKSTVFVFFHFWPGVVSFFSIYEFDYPSGIFRPSFTNIRFVVFLLDCRSMERTLLFERHDLELSFIS